MNILLRVILFTTFILISSCGNSGGGSGDSNKEDDGSSDGGPRGGQSQTGKMPVDWKSIPEKFNPKIYEENFSTKDLRNIDLNILGISNEVSVKKTNTLSDMGKLKIYRVWANSATFGRIKVDTSFDKLKVSNYTGNQRYSCSKKITNGKLVSIDGGCNLFVEIILPNSSEIEVYSGQKLVSNRYFPMSIDELMENIDSGFNQGKFEAVERFLESYKETRKALKLSSLELEEILKEFTFTDKFKFSTLKQVYIYVTDQESLGEVIENTFTFEDDKEKARRIVGL